MSELTPKQQSVLDLLVKQKGVMTATGVARELNLEKALVTNILQQLVDMDLVKKYEPYQYTAVLPAQTKRPPAKKVDQEAERKKAVTTLAKKEKEALKVSVAAEPEQAPDPVAPLVGDERPDFKTLVLRGLAKLNAQLGYQPHRIDDLDLKIETLSGVAGAVGKVDPNVEDVLLAIIKDLQAVGERSP